MKKRNVFVICLVVLSLWVTLAACASTPDGGDMALAANVKSALETDPSLRTFNIGIETRNGVVILTGWVSSQDDVTRAGQVAQGVQGTRSVENKLAVR
jgi:osmotically-inducible protein OsmY